MRTVTEEQPTQVNNSVPAGLETFSETLRNGRTVTIREMTGKDLVYIEEELGDLGETRKSFRIIELLNVGDTKISYDDIESFGVRDIKKISDLVARANGDYEPGSANSPK